MARDGGLAALARLRRLETAEAQRRLAVQAGQEAAAAGRLAAAGAALRGEHAADAEAWRLWLPRGLAERDRAGLARAQEESRLQAAQALLAEARAAERAVEWLRERRAAEARRAAERRAQALLDEAAARLAARR
ncbi:hypothetical protein [Roseicella aquatilis]|uniref:Flagellar FliJ protein n=1 Tax=Roseicella aquatilis TaxID=2527868 RepID=A0A4V2WL52_9PROT|nr:hypothetical protein [Roseicella aquatilis]TCZ61249.1 hypothetical protein EXY23_11910 [Roseicella aquatilis]